MKDGKKSKNTLVFLDIFAKIFFLSQNNQYMVIIKKLALKTSN